MATSFVLMACAALLPACEHLADHRTFPDVPRCCERDRQLAILVLVIPQALFDALALRHQNGLVFRFS